MKFENMRQNLRAIGAGLDEQVTQFLEGADFVHAVGCKNKLLNRNREVDEEFNKETVFRSCSQCGASDSLTRTYRVYIPFRWGG